MITLPIPTESDLVHLETCDPSVRLRRLVELAIVRKLVTDLIAAGFTITVDDGDDEPVKQSTDILAIMDAAFAVDECHLFTYPSKSSKYIGWVSLVYGNDGPDVISDYTTNLEEHLKATNDYATALEAWF